MAEQKESNVMLKTWVVGILTVAYICGGLLILVIRGDDLLNLLAIGKLNELGDFLAGALTPVAFIWLVYGYLVQGDELRLQRNELRLQREELHLQRDELRLQHGELKETRKTLGVQVKMMKEQAAAERDWRQKQADRDSDRNMALGVVPRMGR